MKDVRGESIQAEGTPGTGVPECWRNNQGASVAGVETAAGEGSGDEVGEVALWG